MKLNLLFLLVYIFCGCEAADDDQFQQPGGTDPDPAFTDSISYLALGDSYTIGEAVDAGQKFPAQLADSLEQMKIKVKTLKVIARTGWTTDELQSGIDAEEHLSTSYDLVSLLIGVNNQFRGRPVSAYETEFVTLLEQAISFAGGRRDRVLVISIPDYAYTPYGQGDPSISMGIDEYNSANRRITDSLAVTYVDITPVSREGLEDPALVASDGLHPSALQYARWVSLMLPEVKEMLQP